jgi:hypothetical protein
MNFTKTIPLLAAAAALAVPAAASADTLVQSAPGAQNLAAGGGYLAWSAPAADGAGFQLTVRAPDGTVSTPSIARFDTAPDASIGSGGTQTAANRPLVAVYARGGDVYQLDLRTGTESKVAGASSSAYKEASPSIQYGRLTFVRTGGRNNGIFLRDKGRTRKLSDFRPSELAYNGSRIAYPHGTKLVIRNVSGKGRASTVRLASRPSSLAMSRYSVTFVSDHKAFQAGPFGGSGRPERVSTARESSTPLPATLDSIAYGGAEPRFYLDAEGLKRISAQHPFSR